MLAAFKRACQAIHDYPDETEAWQMVGELSEMVQEMSRLGGHLRGWYAHNLMTLRGQSMSETARSLGQSKQRLARIIRDDDPMIDICKLTD